MFAIPSTALILGILSHSAIVRAQINTRGFLGCASKDSLDIFAYNIESDSESDAGNTQESCLNHCNGIDYQIAAYLTSTTEAEYCYCDNSLPPLQPYQIVEGADGLGNCNDNTGGVYDISTDYQFEYCSSTVDDEGTVGQSNQGSMEDCFAQCDTYTWAYVMPVSDSEGGPETFMCECGSGDVGGAVVDCASNVFFAYDHTAASSPSIVERRRKRRANAPRHIKMRGRPNDQSHGCPAGLTACNLENRDGTSYECIDTDSELESCGGCMYGIYGLLSTNTSGVE
uniref:WSC domain-containing protein n=1 Tax=Kwoniella dejecticola CBS 10117 TaxID=1296121 RepID=A0A1A6A9T6_9TREE|nr:uncharacterized protein I303_02836 [Kwoniella dejecticola CBS 10117]OBR86821.1 hypothetical protein I303_02836 [Kwoniella dejecticola CBS 10117]